MEMTFQICEAKRNDSAVSDNMCFECCSDDYCNNKGCGENGKPYMIIINKKKKKKKKKSEIIFKSLIVIA